MQVSWEDARAYARWAGKQLPTEAQWERAARFGTEAQTYPWGDELVPATEHRTNIWQGVFPTTDTCEDGFGGTAPVRSYPPSPAGLFDMSGNVWEWTSDQYRPDTYARRAGESVQDPTGPDTTADPRHPHAADARVHRGGSFLCHASYCASYVRYALLRGVAQYHHR